MVARLAVESVAGVVVKIVVPSHFDCHKKHGWNRVSGTSNTVKHGSDVEVRAVETVDRRGRREDWESHV